MNSFTWFWTNSENFALTTELLKLKTTFISVMRDSYKFFNVVLFPVIYFFFYP